jgi:DNA modification methylase
MIELLHGDCLERLRELPDCSVDACVTDPPYGLRFMGKAWDYDVPQAAVWREVLRVLKPGGHLLAFAGTRTQHRMAVQIEDAGFEIRDLIAWVYGSGFPKSLDVSKAIDKLDAKDDQERRRLRFTAWVRGTGVTSREINEATGTNMGGHYTTAASQPAIMTREHLQACRHLLGDVPEWVEREADIRSIESQNFKAREVVGEKTSGLSAGSGNTVGKFTDSRNERGMVNITAPATPGAQQWAGWGTALKPALEPITVARKPLVGAVAANVLAHGTGGINVDGCRVEANDLDALQKNWDRVQSASQGIASTGLKAIDLLDRAPTGRWPTNLIHDGSEEVVGLFPQTTSGSRKAGQYSGSTGSNSIGEFGEFNSAAILGDSGSAARFFYCAKASKADRGAENVHPTVKPTELMRYLVRLVTPPGGVVLDPFMGSGSTGKAAVLEGFRFIGIEREAEYIEIARGRIQVPEQVQGSLL